MKILILISIALLLTGCNCHETNSCSTASRNEVPNTDISAYYEIDMPHSSLDVDIIEFIPRNNRDYVCIVAEGNNSSEFDLECIPKVAQ